MGSLSSSHWPLIMVHMLLLQLRPVQVQGIDPLSQKIRRLNEQFQQFQALTQARLNMLALNQNRNSSWGLEIRVQALNDHYYSMSQDLEHLKQSTAQEIEGLREWCRKLEKKSKRIEGRMVLMERNLRENCHHTQKEKPDLGQNISDLRQEFQSQEERLAALQDQRDELLVGLKALQESLKNQALRLTRVEGQLGEVLHLSGGGNIRSLAKEGGSLNSSVTPQKYYEPRRRGQPHSGERPGRNLNGYNSPDLQPRPNQDHATNQPKHLKVKKPRPQPDSHLLIQEQYPDLKPLSTDYLPQPDSYHPDSQIQVQAHTRPYPVTQEQLQPHQSVSYRHVHIHPQVQQPVQLQRHPQVHNLNDSSEPRALSQVLTRPELSRERQSRTRPGAPELQASDILSRPQSEPYQPRATERKGEETGTEVDTSVIHSFLQLPLRHKIPKRPVPKKHPTICNVDSMLFFPTASAENYVTFAVSLPHLPELSVCLWLRVEASHVGTLFSYATDDNDNQLVLYGRNSSASSPSFSASSSSARSSHPSSSFSPSSYHSASAPSLDFVIGDTVFRRLPMSSLLDARWHHLCVLWSSIQGRFWHYSDRRLSSSGANFRKGWEIPGGGSAVLGQEQDSVGGGFDPAEGFAGQMAGFRIWNRVLSPLEVEGVAEGRGVPRGVVLDMEDIKEVHGEVQQVACECLEHCI